MQEYAIYTLVDPRDNLPYYVGMTENPQRRFQEHLTHVSKRSAKGGWMGELLAQKLTPLMEIIEQVSGNMQDALKREIYWIQTLKEQVMPLTNINGTQEDLSEKITLYLPWRLLEKLDIMALEYKRRTRKRTDHNKLMRMMVEKFTLDDLLS